jgi:hypothetical protein
MNKTFEAQVEEIMETEKECVFFFENTNQPITDKLYNDNILAFDFTNFDIIKLNYEDYETEFKENEFPSNQPAFFHFDEKSELNIIEILTGE